MPKAKSIIFQIITLLGVCALVYAQTAPIGNLQGKVNENNALVVEAEAVVVDSISNTVNAAITNGSATDLNSHAITVGAATMDADAVGDECTFVTTASTNAASCKTTASNFYGFEVYNTTTTVAYLRLYNLAASPTCSSSTGFVRSIPLPPASAAGLVGGVVRIAPFPTDRYGTGVAWCITGGASSTDNTNAGAGIYGAVFAKET